VKKKIVDIKALMLLILLILIISYVFADSASLITDKRTEVVSWLPGIHCTERTLSEKDLYLLPEWDGPAEVLE